MAVCIEDNDDYYLAIACHSATLCLRARARGGEVSGLSGPPHHEHDCAGCRASWSCAVQVCSGADKRQHTCWPCRERGVADEPPLGRANGNAQDGGRARSTIADRETTGPCPSLAFAPSMPIEKKSGARGA
jgi:hypothetical protein